ncbi:MAG TPA: PorT family protein, partial [Butyricimonas virosa]|nr:PorT family protein [Butyricimonas virosa]
PSNQYFDYKMLHMRGSLVLSYNLFDIKPPKLNPFR